MVVPTGSFLMGSPADEEARTGSEGPQHRVTIARPFAVGKYEVTFAEWAACVAAKGCTRNPVDDDVPSSRGKQPVNPIDDYVPWGRGKQPVTAVSWDDITKEYLPWLSRKTGKTYRLLTEAEWEYAARAGTTTAFSTGQTIKPNQANFELRQPIDVGSFPPNAFGLHDMHGNVWEWVQDCWNVTYSGAPTDGSAWTTGDCSHRVLRGGSYLIDPRVIRSANRGHNASDYRISIIGFRLARTLSP
jgi:formylglycine-generating enzyme required for sulfatase activity